MRRLFLCCAVLTTSLASFAAFAADDDSDIREEQRVVIQNRKFKLGFELTLEAATLPLDPFYKGLAGTGRVTYHFNDFHAWELAGGTFAYNLDSSLAKQLFDNFGVQRAELPGLQAMVESDYVMKPFYGKFALANRTLLYQEVYLVVGGTLTYWTDASFRYGPNYGGGIRFFLADWFSVRFDLRHAVVFSRIPFLDEQATLDGVLYLGAGMSFNFGGGV